jgi:dTDP-4-dehydrorhamnose 3,5-epimerase
VFELRPTEVEGAMLVVPVAHGDERGLFARIYDAAIFAEVGLPTEWVQCNTSWNKLKGTLRGMHFQAYPRPDTKIVRCTRGRIFDVAVDLRPLSPTFRRWTCTELTEDNRIGFAIPAGCAHGFLTLEDNCEVHYMMGDIYVPELARGVRWNDPAFAITWPDLPVVIAAKDASWPDYEISQGS